MNRESTQKRLFICLSMMKREHNNVFVWATLGIIASLLISVECKILFIRTRSSISTSMYIHIYMIRLKWPGYEDYFNEISVRIQVSIIWGHLSIWLKWAWARWVFLWIYQRQLMLIWSCHRRRYRNQETYHWKKRSQRWSRNISCHPMFLFLFSKLIWKKRISFQRCSCNVNW